MPPSEDAGRAGRHSRLTISKKASNLDSRCWELFVPSEDSLRTQYRLEQSLALRLREAGKAERRGLYCEIYDELAEQLPDHPLADDGYRETRRREIELQCKLLAPFVDRNSRVLEVGSGDGRLALEMARSVKDYYIFEASRRFSQRLKYPPNVHLFHADQPPFDLPSSSIDVAFSCHVVEHLHPDDLGDFTQEFLRLLVPGGRCICVTPNRLYGPHDISRHFGGHPSGLHLREYTYRELARVFKGSGFSPVVALSGVDQPPRVRSPRPHFAAERMLGLVPNRLRQRLLGPLGRFWATPFRPLEQVVLMGIRPVSSS